MVTDIMIDTEFLSLTYDAHILSIGIVAWDITAEKFTPLDSTHQFPSLDSQTPFKAKIDQGTLVWWLQQSIEARGGIAHGQKILYRNIVNVFWTIFYFFQDHKEVKRVWSHGAVCDLPLLKHWYDKLGMEVPWDYRTPRDTRTLFEAIGHTPKRNYGEGVAHDALSDAMAQAEQVHTAWKLRRNHVQI